MFKLLRKRIYRKYVKRIAKLHFQFIKNYEKEEMAYALTYFTLLSEIEGEMEKLLFMMAANDKSSFKKYQAKQIILELFKEKKIKSYIHWVPCLFLSENGDVDINGIYQEFVTIVLKDTKLILLLYQQEGIGMNIASGFFIEDYDSFHKGVINLLRTLK